LIGVVLRDPAANQNALNALENAYVKTASGDSVPLTQIARIDIALEPGIEWRRSRLPTVTVRGVVPDGVQSPDVT